MKIVIINIDLVVEMKFGSLSKLELENLTLNIMLCFKLI